MSKIRMYLAERLLSWAYNMTPWNSEGQKIRKHISNYWMDKIVLELEETEETNKH